MQMQNISPNPTPQPMPPMDGGGQVGQKSFSKVIIIVVGVVVVLLIVGGFFGWRYVHRNPSSEPVVPEAPAATSTPPEENLQQTTYLHDQDRDGIPDDKEKELGTSDRNFDTDGDGLTDKVEIDTYHTDPKNPDTDGDGFWDGVEIIKGYNPNGQGKLKS